MDTDHRSAFSAVHECPCHQGPALWNPSGLVYFACECGRKSDEFYQGDGAAFRAAHDWNDRLAQEAKPKNGSTT